MSVSIELPETLTTRYAALSDTERQALQERLNRVAADVLQEAAPRTTPRPRHGLMRFAGAGAGRIGALPSGSDAQTHLNELRDEWDDRP